jgi:hypothetical protein
VVAHQEHASTALRFQTEILPSLNTWTSEEDLAALGDLGYHGGADTIIVPFKRPKNVTLTDGQDHIQERRAPTYNMITQRQRAVARKGSLSPRSDAPISAKS